MFINFNLRFLKFTQMSNGSKYGSAKVSPSSMKSKPLYYKNFQDGVSGYKYGGSTKSHKNASFKLVRNKLK